MQIPADSIMVELKNSTQALHDETEHGAFNKKLIMGRIPLESYVDSLGQLFLIHRALERHLAAHRNRVPAMTKVLRDYQFQEPYLRTDLQFFGRDPEAEQPLPVTTAFIEQLDRMAAECPTALLGVHYVFEGSNNGSKYISVALRRAYGFENGNGTCYFDPYGEHQREYWAAFKADMSVAQFTEAERRAVVEAACDTFRAVMKLHEALHARLSAVQEADGVGVGA